VYCRRYVGDIIIIFDQSKINEDVMITPTTWTIYINL
jgi:hypothetical protein